MATSTIDTLAPYLDRVMNDQDLQDRIRKTVKSGASTASRARGKSPKKAAKDATLQKSALATLMTARGVVQAFQEPEKKPKKRWLRRLLLLGVLGGGVYLAVDEEARNKVLDAVSGGGSGTAEV